MRSSGLRRVASRIDDGLDHARMHLRRLTGLEDPVSVQLYTGYGTNRRLFISGSVFIAKVRDENRRRPALLRDVRATLERYRERGVMGARVTIRQGEAEVTATSDSDGYFQAELDVGLSASDRVLWPEVVVRLDDYPGMRQPPSQHKGEALVAPAAPELGIISDFDDTVLRTGIHDLKRNWREAIRSDPSLREAFPGLAELYSALIHDKEGVQRRPVFYVSSAAWGFYDFFREFLAMREIPQGPIFLKNYGLDRNKWFSGGHRSHKAHVIEWLFDTYPDMRFILVGDSGQHDAKIYSEAVSRYPDRVLAVWIRDLAGPSARRAEVRELVEELKASGARAAFGPDLVVAARQAAEEGWMPAEAVEPVEAAIEASVEAQTA